MIQEFKIFRNRSKMISMQISLNLKLHVVTLISGQSLDGKRSTIETQRQCLHYNLLQVNNITRLVCLVDS